MSDHKQIYLQLNKFKPPPLVRVSYDAIDYWQLCQLAEVKGLNNIFNNYDELEDKIKQCILESKVTKLKILNTPQKDWLTNDIINGIKERNLLWNQHKNDLGSKAIEAEFKRKRNIVAKQIQNTKSSYYLNQFSNCMNVPKKMWKLIHNLAGNKIKQNCAPQQLLLNSKLITDTYEICEGFNGYFANIGQHLAEQIPNKYHNSVFVSESNKSNSELITLEPCSADEVSKTIDNLRSNSSSGIDKITVKAIKCLRNFISHSLARCFNKLMKNGEFSNTLKVAKISPIYKTGPKSDPGNYRPISVLLSKIFERISFSRLIKYVDRYNLLSERQYGFRAKSNTTAATIHLITKIKCNIDAKHVVLGIFIDLKKAFDTVSHKLLLHKLSNIGSGGNALKILTSYLIRSQVVKIGNIETSTTSATYGVPQGSILGPLLFLLYINKITELKLHGHLTLYADDTCLFYFGVNIHDIIRQAQEDLDILYEWLQYNLLTININKTCYAIFKSKNKPIPSHKPLTINNSPLEQKLVKYIWA